MRSDGNQAIECPRIRRGFLDRRAVWVEVKKAFRSLPASYARRRERLCRVDTLLEQIRFKAKILRSLEQADRGEVVPHEEVMEDLNRWLESLGHPVGVS